MFAVFLRIPMSRQFQTKHRLLIVPKNCITIKKKKTVDAFEIDQMMIRADI